MSEYLLINILTIIFPLVLTFEKKLKFYNNLPYLFLSIIIVGGAYIYWDVLATARGDWAFNDIYIVGIRFFGLPIEEILFFVTVPYAMIFLYETFNFYIKDKRLKFNCRNMYFVAFFYFLIALNNYSQPYTFTVMIFMSLFFVLANLSKSDLLSSRNFWLFMILGYIPFSIVNYILTSLPIVTYGKNAIWNFRITTIPVEDFFYSFSLIGLSLLIYTLAKRQWKKN